MSFRFERISEQDFLRYRLGEIDQRFSMASSRRWAIDHDHHAYLRYMYYDQEQPSRKTFCFYWQQQPYLVQLESHGQSLANQQWCTKWRLLSSKKFNNDGPDYLIEPSADLLHALKAALSAYRDGSLNPGYSSHVAEFDF